MARTDHSTQRALLDFGATTLPDPSRAFALDSRSELLPSDGSRRKLIQQVAGWLLVDKAANFASRCEDLHLVKTEADAHSAPLAPPFPGAPPGLGSAASEVKGVLQQPSRGDASFDPADGQPGVARCSGGKAAVVWLCVLMDDQGKPWQLGLELSWAEYSRFTWRDLPEPVPLAVPPSAAQASAAAAGPRAGGASSSSGGEPAAKRPRTTATRATSVGFESELPLDGSRRLVRVEGAACSQLNGIHRTTSKSAYEPKLADGRELAAADVAGGRVTAVTCMDFEGDQVLTFQLKSLFKEREDGSRQETVTQAELQAALQQLAPAVAAALAGAAPAPSPAAQAGCVPPGYMVQPEVPQLSLLQLRMDILEDRSRLRSNSMAHGQQGGSSGIAGHGIQPAAEGLGAAAVSFNGELQEATFMARIGSPETLHRMMEEPGSLGAHQHHTPPPLPAPPGGWPVTADLAASQPATHQQAAQEGGGYLAMLAPHLPAAPGSGNSALPAVPPFVPLPLGASGAAPGSSEGAALQELIAGRVLSQEFGRDSLAVAWAVHGLLGLQQEGLEAPRDLVWEVNTALYDMERSGRAVKQGTAPRSFKPLWWLPGGASPQDVQT